MHGSKDGMVLVALGILGGFVGGCRMSSPVSDIPPAIAAPPPTDLTGGFVGKTAPGFVLPNADGKPVDVGAIMGKKPVLLVFYRGVWCPFCHGQMAQLGAAKKALTAAPAPAIFAISNENRKAQKTMQSEHKLDFVTFLSDPNGVAAKQYMGTYPNQSVIQPGTFVVDRHRKIVFAYVNQDFRTRATTDAVIAALQKAAQEK